ncbi:CDP-alcohol phosphatidyltransferase family protein [bacterium]|nr:CDP-alcohol phosphatidyltransferase family protein [bacterium]
MRFAGDRKEGKSLLAPAEEVLKKWLLPLVPRKVETYHLTLSTLGWCFGVILFSFLARYDIRWMWAVSLMIFLQYITDLLDGAIGRKRGTGLVKWGYYMDHFLDYLFLCTMLIGYAFLLPDHYKVLVFFVLALFGAFMVNSFLAFAATNAFRIAYWGIGPTEVRLLFILVNALLVMFGKIYLLKSLPYVLTCAAFGLFVTVLQTQKLIWSLDMKGKKQ